MKTIRQGTFETNSSSTHSLTMCSGSEFDKWKNGELFYSESHDKFVSKEERDIILKKLVIMDKVSYENNSYEYKGVKFTYDDRDTLIFTEDNLAEITEEDIENYLDYEFDTYACPMSYEQYFEQMEYETFSDEYKTSSGDKVIAFGYFGNDY